MEAIREAAVRGAGAVPTRWYVIGFGVLAVTVGGWSWWQSRQATVASPRESAPAPFVRMVGQGEGTEGKVLQERAKFFDPTPLFLPTAQNFRSGGLPPRLMTQPGQIFADYDAKFHYGDGVPELASSAAAAPESYADIIARANEVPFAGLGELEIRREPLPERVALIEIKSLQGEQLSQSHTVEGVQPPKLGFGPMEFLVAVGPAGLIGDPVLLSGSGMPEVDVFFRDYLVSSYRLGARLAPGRYRVRVGP